MRIFALLILCVLSEVGGGKLKQFIYLSFYLLINTNNKFIH